MTIDRRMARKIYLMEVYINSHFVYKCIPTQAIEPVAKCLYDELGFKDKIDRINHFVPSVRQMDIARRADVDFVLAYLVKRGYILPKKSEDDDDVPDTVRFYEDANIVQSVWSRYMNGETRRLNHDTFLKIIIALRMPMCDVYDYMRMTANNFNSLDKRDMYILSIIANDYFGAEDAYQSIEDVSDILQYYSEQEVKSGRMPLKQLYDL